MKILIVDDNAHHAELASLRLQKEGWDITTTDVPVPITDWQDYDFILLDYSMPMMTGIDVLKKIRELEIRSPVIFLTGHGNELIASEAIKQGAYDYVIKDTKLVYLDRLPTVIREARSKHDLIETNRFLIQELRRANDRLQKLTFTDEMTEIYNYRFLKNQLETEIRRAERYQKPLSLCLIDIDNFKQINDSFGHRVGDEVLRRVAQILAATVRGVDFVGRYAGDEFLIIFPNTQLSDAIHLCERIRRAVSEEIFETSEGIKPRTTLSIGVSDFQLGRRDSVDSLVEAADRCLYKAKEAGRNRVEATLRLASADNRPPEFRTAEPSAST